MPVKILMPSLSPTMTSGTLSKWLKKEGDYVKPGEVIAEIETDKATMEVESVDEGVLAKILIKAGTENVLVNSLIGVILEEGEDHELVDELVSKSTIEKLVESQENTVNRDHSAQNLNIDVSSDLAELNSFRIFASPLAKRIASTNNVDLKNIVGSGPRNRIIKDDVVTHMESKTTGISSSVQLEEYRLVPNNNIRKIIAKRLVESKQNIPHFYLSIECNIDKLLKIRAELNDSLKNSSKTSKISVNDFIILATAKALKNVPNANDSWDAEAIRYYNNVDISVAVAIDSGLITPVVRKADQKTILQLSTEMKELIVKAKENRLLPEEFQGVDSLFLT